MLCLPKHPESQLLKAVLSDDEKIGYQNLLEWQQVTDFEGQLSKSEIRLLPMAWQKYKNQLAGTEQNARFGGLYKKSFYNNSRLFHQLPLIIAALEQGQFPYAFTKGVALQYYLYGTKGTRPMNDMDILIGKEHLGQAIALLGKLGYYAMYPEITVELCLTGESHAYSLKHDSWKDIDLHSYATPMHNRKLTNHFFFEDAETFDWLGARVPLVTPEKLLLFILINYQVTDEWHWIADAVLLHKKYSLSFSKLREVSQQMNLPRATLAQLRYLREEFGIGSQADLDYFQQQPSSLADQWLTNTTDPSYEKKRSMAVIASFYGLGDEKRPSKLILPILRWYLKRIKRHPGQFFTKSYKVVGDYIRIFKGK